MCMILPTFPLMSLFLNLISFPPSRVCHCLSLLPASGSISSHFLPPSSLAFLSSRAPSVVVFTSPHNSSAQPDRLGFFPSVRNIWAGSLLGHWGQKIPSGSFLQIFFPSCFPAPLSHLGPPWILAPIPCRTSVRMAQAEVTTLFSL